MSDYDQASRAGVPAITESDILEKMQRLWTVWRDTTAYYQPELFQRQSGIRIHNSLQGASRYMAYRQPLFQYLTGYVDPDRKIPSWTKDYTDFRRSRDSG